MEKTIKLTPLQDAIISVIEGQPYWDPLNGSYNYKFIEEEKKAALRLEKKKLIKRISKSGNYFSLTKRFVEYKKRFKVEIVRK